MATSRKQSENLDPKTNRIYDLLDKVQKFYVAGHRKDEPRELAKIIKGPIKAVRGYLAHLDRLAHKKELKAVADAAAEAAKPKPPDPGVKKFRVDDLMGKSKRGGVTIMTEAASEHGDAVRKGNHMSDKLAQNVMKIRD